MTNLRPKCTNSILYGKDVGRQVRDPILNLIEMDPSSAWSLDSYNLARLGH